MLKSQDLMPLREMSLTTGILTKRLEEYEKI